MNARLTSMAAAGVAGISLLTGCGEMKMKVWPFGNDTVQERSRTPVNATEYQCAAGKRFYVRTLEGGAAVWLILPERELRLERTGPDSGTRYAKGSTMLEISGNAATLKDGTATAFAGCKTGGDEPPSAATK